MNCGTCKFAKPIEGNDDAIRCQRNPPAITAVVNNQITSHWPLLGKDQWCGDYERAGSVSPQRKAGKRRTPRG